MPYAPRIQRTPTRKLHAGAPTGLLGVPERAIDAVVVDFRRAMAAIDRDPSLTITGRAAARLAVLRGAVSLVVNRLPGCPPDARDRAVKLLTAMARSSHQRLIDSIH